MLYRAALEMYERWSTRENTPIATRHALGKRAASLRERLIKLEATMPTGMPTSAPTYNSSADGAFPRTRFAVLTL